MWQGLDLIMFKDRNMSQVVVADVLLSVIISVFQGSIKKRKEKKIISNVCSIETGSFPAPSLKVSVNETAKLTDSAGTLR